MYEIKIGNVVLPPSPPSTVTHDVFDLWIWSDFAKQWGYRGRGTVLGLRNAVSDFGFGGTMYLKPTGQRVAEVNYYTDPTARKPAGQVYQGV